MTQGNKISQSNQLLKKIIDKIMLTPNQDDKTKLDVNVMGNLAGMLAIAADQDIPSFVIEDFFERAILIRVVLRTTQNGSDSGKQEITQKTLGSQLLSRVQVIY